MNAELLARLLPRAARRMLRAPVDAVSREWVRALLAASGFRLAEGAPVLNYGGAATRSADAPVHGGRVKLMHLDHVFPENRNRFNLLYLVSSAIPRHALELVRFARARGVKFVWNQNGVAYPAWAGKFTAEVNDPMRALLREADFVVYQSEFCRGSADRFLGAAACPSEILFNPVEPAFFRPPERPPVLSEIRLLAMGTHTYRERVTVALRCLAELWRAGRPARLTVAGPLQWRNAEREVRREIDALGLRASVTLHPAFSQARAAQLYGEHHVLLHPKHMDPCPTVVLEALACGLPVVAPANGGLPELVDASCGRLVPAPEDWEKMHVPNPAEIAAAVMEIAADWPALSANARHRAVAHFAAKPWLERHRAIFKRLMEKAG